MDGGMKRNLIVLSGIVLVLWGFRTMAQVVIKGQATVRGAAAARIGTTQTSGTDWPVHAGGNIQTAINSANCGDTITLDAGVTYNVTGLVLPAKSGPKCTGTSSDYITIRPSDYASLPAGRINPFNASMLAKIVNTAGTAPTFSNQASASSYWKLYGLEITNTPGAFVATMVQFIGGAHQIVDHVYMHPGECPNTTAPYNTSGYLGTVMDTMDGNVTNSYFDCWWGTPLGGVQGQTGQANTAVESDIGPGPVTIWNNYFGVWYNALFMGGGDPPSSNTATILASPAPTTTSVTLSSVANLQVGDNIAIQVPGSAPTNAWCERPSPTPCWGDGSVQSIVGTTVTVTAPLTGFSYNATPAPLVGGSAQWRGQTVSHITVSQNYFNIPTTFAAWVQTYTPNHNNPKSWFEIKICETCTIYGNIFDGWSSVLGLNNQDQYCSSPWTTTDHMTLQSNWFKQTDRGTITGGASYSCLVRPGHDFLITNNLWEGPFTNEGGGTELLQFLSGTSPGYIYSHNTALAGFTGGTDGYTQSAFVWGHGNPTYYGVPPVTYRDNIFGIGNYGNACDNGAMVPGCVSSQTEDHNLIVRNVNPSSVVPSAQFPNSAVFPGIQLHWSSVLFTDPTNHNYELTSSSPGYRQASDGTDIGVNWTSFSNATAGVITGNPTHPFP